MIQLRQAGEENEEEVCAGKSTDNGVYKECDKREI
jgi:hypothetical protein